MPEYFEAELAVLNSRLLDKGLEPLREQEFFAARLFTGPMYSKVKDHDSVLPTYCDSSRAPLCPSSTFLFATVQLRALQCRASQASGAERRYLFEKGAQRHAERLYGRTTAKCTYGSCD